MSKAGHRAGVTRRGGVSGGIDNRNGGINDVDMASAAIG
jgi:hypothetical protein